MIRSSAFVIALFYVVLGLAALALLATPLWYGWRVTVEDARLQLLQDDTLHFIEVFHQQGPRGLAAFIDERLNMQIPGEQILLFGDPGRKLLAGNLRQWPEEIPDQPGIYTVPLRIGGQTSAVKLVRTVLPEGYNLVVGRDQAQYRPLETRFRTSLAEAIAVLLLFGLCGALLIRRAVLSRIDALNHTVSAIVRGDLGARLATGSGNDELDRLSRTINLMLVQIEQLVNGVRNVSNAIAHDLRIPLTELRARLETLHRPGEASAAIEAAIADVDRVVGIFNALLRLAEIESGARHSGFEPVDLADLAARVVEFYRPLAELKTIALDFRDHGCRRIMGDPVLLAQAIGNLIDNAVKFTPESGRIAVEVAPGRDEGVTLSVADDGAGIADDDKPRVTERFYRGSAGRGKPGVGLGLSLVQAVATLHSGRLELADNHPGLMARMILA